jgi:uncharacterized membrane protein YjfL (UPF0719 family)
LTTLGAVGVLDSSSSLVSSHTVLEAFKYAPAIVALLIVIFLLFRLLHKRDGMLERMINASEADVTRQSKLIALLEIIIQRGTK